MYSPACIRALETVNEIRHVLTSPDPTASLERLRGLLDLAVVQIGVVINEPRRPRKYTEIAP